MMSGAYLAFETGGTKLVAGVADRNGALVEARVLPRHPANRAPQSLVQLVEAAQQLRSAHEANGATFRAIGFGYGGQVSRAQPRVLRCPHEEGWEDVDVRDVLQREFGLPSVIENDCKLAALAEARLGAGRVQRTVFYITIGTGIGGGIVRDGQIVDFGDTGEAEVGHIVVDPGGMLCGCGNRGCLETVCAGPGIPPLARRVASRADVLWDESLLFRRTLSDDRLTSADVFAAWHSGDPLAEAVVQQAARYLGYAASMVIQIVNPDVILFGGGVGTSSERFIRAVQGEAEGYVMPNLRGRCRFAISQLREHVVAQGAAQLAAQTFPADPKVL